MRRLAGVLIGCGLLLAGLARAQFGRGSGWSTSGNDAQRSFWIRADAKISPEALQKPGFSLVWKIKAAADAKQAGAMAPPNLMDGYIGYRGFRSLGFVSPAADSIVAMDTDLGRIEWQKRVPAAPAQQGACAGLTAELARPVSVAFPPAMAGGRGFGRGGPARSAVGKPGEGAVTLEAVNAARAGAAPGRAGRGAAGRGRGPAPGRGPAFVRSPIFLHVLTTDGMLHSMYVSNGEEPQPALKFLPPGARAEGLIFVDNVAYAATTQGCGGAPEAVWALDLESKQVASWKPASGGISGSAGPAFGPDGTLYVSTSAGDLVALEPKTLKVKDTYRAGQPFITSPVIFEHKDKALLAAATKDGTIHVLDSKSLGGNDSRTPLHKASAGSIAGAIASWQDQAGTRWLLAPVGSAIATWKLAEKGSSLNLEAGWKSREMASPQTPIIVNGVVFAVSGGGSAPPVAYAFDGTTGKEMWNSGKTITSAVRTGGLSAGGAQLYVGTYDGTLYTFGFPIEH